MFTPGRIAFAIVFAIAFIYFMVLSYRKDSKNHEAYYKGAAKKVAIYGTIAVILFVGIRFLIAMVL